MSGVAVLVLDVDAVVVIVAAAVLVVVILVAVVLDVESYSEVVDAVGVRAVVVRELFWGDVLGTCFGRCIPRRLGTRTPDA